MYTPHVEELEARDLLNSSFSPQLHTWFRFNPPPSPAAGHDGTGVQVIGYPAPKSGTIFAPAPENAGPTAPAAPQFEHESGSHAWAPVIGLPPPPGGAMILERTFDVSGHVETVEIMAPPGFSGFSGFPEHHFPLLPSEYGASVIAPVAAVAASEVADPAVDSPPIRSGTPTVSAVQTSPDSSHAISVAGVDPLSFSAAQRLSAASVPRLDTLVGLPTFRLDPQINQAVRFSGAPTARDPEVAAAMLEPAPASLTEPSTLPRAESSESGSEATLPPLPVTQRGSGLSMLPDLNVTALERAMQHFLRQLHSTGDDLVGKHEKAGLGVWLVAGTAAVAACEIARRQMRASRAKLAVEWNWIAGVPPEPPFGQ